MLRQELRAKASLKFGCFGAGWRPLPPAGYIPAPDPSLCRPYCLFDLAADPREETNIHADQPAVLEYLLGRLVALTAVHVPAEEVCGDCTVAEVCEATEGKNRGHWGPFRS